MREIKFRGKRIDNNEWVYGYFYINDKGKNMIHNPNVIPRHFRIIPETVGQYTGLKDENGVEIYEGDVVRVYGGEYCQGYWEYDHQRTVKDIRYDSYELGECEYIEVIGNIYDNPELAEVSK